MDTTPLLSLRQVTGELSVSGSRDNDPRAFDGLSRLESVGALTLADLFLTDLSAFQGLRAIGPEAGQPGAAAAGPRGELSIRACSGLASLSGLSGLERVSELHLSELPELTSVSGLDGLRELSLLEISACPLRDLNALAELELGALYLSGSEVRDLTGVSLRGGGLESALSLRSNPRLTTLGGWQPPSELFEVELSGNGSLRDLRGLEPLTRLYYLSIEGESELTSLEGLGGLVSVGTLTLTGNPRLESLAGLAQLREIGSLAISSSGALSTLAGLAVGAGLGNVQLDGLPALADLSGIGSASLSTLALSAVPLVDLRGLEQSTLRQSLTLTALPELTSLAGLPSTIDWGAFSLSLSQCPRLRDLGALAPVSGLDALALDDTGLTDLDALANLRQVARLSVTHNAQLAQIDGIGALEQLEWLEISDNPALHTLPSFAGLELGCDDCAAGIELAGNAALEAIGPWPWLANGSLQVRDNAALTSLSVPALRASSLLEVTDNASLTTLDVSSLQEAGWVIVTGNAALDDTALLAIARGPSFPRVKITRNLGGPARLAACPWLEDGDCDEATEDCMPGTDALDCGDR